MSIFTPFPPKGGSGGGGSYDDTALKARVGETETVNRTQDVALDDHGRRILTIEETPPLDLAPIAKRVSDLEAGGVVGPAGPQGPVGPAGADGARGPIGPQGPAGLDGQPGRDGVAGAQGIQGPVGPEGAVGPAGAQGAQGIQGLPGADGAPGTQGPVGPRGLQGPAGADAPPYDDAALLKRISDVEKADIDFDRALDLETDTRAEADRQIGVRLKAIEDGGGVAGPAGPAGPPGPVGPAGADGGVGPAGPVGPAGAPGPAGERGPAGADGAAGPQGQAGPAGERGLQGLPGAEGARGPAGADGAAGAQGPQGIKGDQGIQGLKGDQGSPGAQGPQGPAGPSGSGSKLIGKARRKVSETDVLLSTLMPAGTKEFELVYGGGGASGIAVYQGDGDQVAHGGHPGLVRRSGRITFVDGMTITTVIGAGGASAGNTTSPNVPSQNAGSGTIVTIKLANGTVVYTDTAPGGPTWLSRVIDRSSINVPNPHSYLRPAFEEPAPAKPGTSVPSAAVNGRALMTGQPVLDGPGAGGGARRYNSGANNQNDWSGDGSSVRYTYRAEFPHFDRVSGGLPASQTGNGTAGSNPHPDEAGSYGSGGAGGNQLQNFTIYPGTAGGFPCAGGGGCAVGPPNSGSPAANVAISGAGAAGMVDLFGYG